MTEFYSPVSEPLGVGCPQGCGFGLEGCQLLLGLKPQRFLFGGSLPDKSPHLGSGRIFAPPGVWEYGELELPAHLPAPGWRSSCGMEQGEVPGAGGVAATLAAPVVSATPESKTSPQANPIPPQ